MNRQIFVSHSSKDDQRGRDLRALLLQKLQDRSRDVFLDEDDLQPGDLWRPKVYRALAECDGAVLLLSPPALESDWVQREASILAWRRDLRAHFGLEMRVLAVPLFGVTRAEISELPAFGLLKLEEAQFTRPFGAEEDLESVADAIAEAFPPLPARGSDAMQRWTEDVAAWLGKVDDNWLRRAADELDVPPGDLMVQEGRFILAAALLHGELRKVENALWELLGGRPPNALDLFESIMPAGLPASSATKVVEALRRPPTQRLVSINAQYPNTAELLVRRASCCDPKFIVIPPGSAQNEEAAYEEIIEAVATGSGMINVPFDPARLAANTRYQYVVVLQRNSGGVGLTVGVLTRLVERLRRELDVVLFVIVAGPEAVDLGIPGLLVVDPPLEPGREDDVDIIRNQLQEQFFPGKRRASA
jgi:hypothetical protein